MSHHAESLRVLARRIHIDSQEEEALLSAAAHIEKLEREAPAPKVTWESPHKPDCMCGGCMGARTAGMKRYG